MAKLLLLRFVLKLAGEAVQIHGGYGFTKDFPVEKFLEIQSYVPLVREQVKFKNWSSQEKF